MGGNIFPSAILSVATTDAQVITPTDSMYLGNPKSCIAIRVKSRTAYSRVRIEVAETPFFSRSVSEFVLNKPRTEYTIYPDIIWNYEALKNNLQAEPVSVAVTVEMNGKELGQRVRTFSVRSVNECLLGYVANGTKFHDTGIFFAAYVNVLFVASHYMNAAQPTRTATAFARGFARLPRINGTNKTIFIAALLIASTVGILQLKTQNELALLNRIPAELMSDVQFVGRALSPASPGQLFVIQGSDSESVLQRNETLQKRLAQLTADGIIGMSPNPAALLPSQKSQRQAQALTTEANRRALELTEKTLESDFPAPIEGGVLLTPEIFKRIAPASLTRFWLSDTSLLVPLSGVTAESLPYLQKLASEVKGVRFVNTTAEVAESLATYRNGVLYTLLFALGVIAVILALGLGRRFLHFWMPTALSIVLTLGVCGFAGMPFSLFSVLPRVLVVGLGVDYAIILYSEANPIAARNSVFLAASSTLLAFGLLAFSSTPALHIFGLTLLIAMASVLLTTVLLRPET